MQENSTKFLYDETSLERLERSLSLERLDPYLALAGGNRKYAISLYEWNTKVSEALYSILQGFEVTLRNAVHEALTAGFRSAEWYDIAPLEEEQRKLVREAKKRVTDDGRVMTPGRVVAELMFGFWTALAGKAYAQTLWDPYLHKAFRQVRIGRKTVAKRLKKIRFLRNRVAHHESVIGKVGHERDLKKDVEEIIEATSWICSTTALWISHNSSFDQHYAARPTPPSEELPFTIEQLTH